MQPPPSSPDKDADQRGDKRRLVGSDVRAGANRCDHGVGAALVPAGDTEMQAGDGDQEEPHVDILGLPPTSAMVRSRTSLQASPALPTSDRAIWPSS